MSGEEIANSGNTSTDKSESFFIGILYTEHNLPTMLGMENEKQITNKRKIDDVSLQSAFTQAKRPSLLSEFLSQPPSLAFRILLNHRFEFAGHSLL